MREPRTMTPSPATCQANTQMIVNKQSRRLPRYARADDFRLPAWTCALSDVHVTYASGRKISLLLDCNQNIPVMSASGCCFRKEQCTLQS
jgi:hypothetical protein